MLLVPTVILHVKTCAGSFPPADLSFTNCALERVKVDVWEVPEMVPSCGTSPREGTVVPEIHSTPVI